MDIYKGIMQGLEEAVQYNEGKLSAKSAVMSVSPVPKFDAGEIKNIRNKVGMTQYLFAGFMGVSPKTVEAWEAGRNIPNGTACRMLSMLNNDPQLPEKFHIAAR